MMALLAQGSGSSVPAGPGTSAGLEERPFTVTKSVDATLVEITRNVVVVKQVDRKGKKKIYEIRLDPKMQLAADKKTELGQAKRKIVLEDFKPGQFVRLIWNPELNMAVSLKLLPEKPNRNAWRQSEFEQARLAE
jgi:hypothetical protein